jgi:uncharacterized membrane protein YdjX (TVP38/TMEM64 family)
LTPWFAATAGDFIAFFGFRGVLASVGKSENNRITDRLGVRVDGEYFVIEFDGTNDETR